MWYPKNELRRYRPDFWRSEFLSQCYGVLSVLYWSRCRNKEKAKPDPGTGKNYVLNFSYDNAKYLIDKALKNSKMALQILEEIGVSQSNETGNTVIYTYSTMRKNIFLHVIHAENNQIAKR
ncbi:hypothetical protein [Sphingobacterium kitahiroshimense]|uniref:hypothetical protein n=1 Tax=Sphingobacterium kitahiroshimense TaxID=470446 RepID=UPI0032081A9A